MKKLLLTGFDPFAHYNINPSWEAVKALPEIIGSFSVHKMLLPNIYGTAGRLLLEEAERLKPDVILMTGMDSGSTKLHIDTVAVNLRDALIEDNKGTKPWGEQCPAHLQHILPPYPYINLWHVCKSRVAPCTWDTAPAAMSATTFFTPHCTALTARQ